MMATMKDIAVELCNLGKAQAQRNDELLARAEAAEQRLEQSRKELAVARMNYSAACGERTILEQQLAEAQEYGEAMRSKMHIVMANLTATQDQLAKAQAIIDGLRESADSTYFYVPVNLGPVIQDYRKKYG